jgi:hypothetical protein
MMPNLQDFLTLDRYLTPSIIRGFYGLLVAFIVLFGIINVLAAFATMGYSLLTGIAWLLAAVIATALGLITTRIVTEIVMVLFQNNEHLAALRTHVEGR